MLFSLVRILTNIVITCSSCWSYHFSVFWFASLPRRFDYHNVFQAKLLVDNKTLLDIIVDAIDCNVQTIDIKQEIRLHYPVDDNRIVFSVNVYPQSVHSHMQLNSLHEFS